MFRLVALLWLCLSQVIAGESVVKQSQNHDLWKRDLLAPRNGAIKLQIAVRQADGGATVEQQLLAISDPRSSSFRKHLRADETASLSVPARESVHAIEFWLRAHGLLKDATLYNGMFEIDTTIRDAEQLLNTTYFIYSDGARNVTRTERYYLPVNIEKYIDFITPTTVFPKRTSENPSARKPAGKHTGNVQTSHGTAD